jgi:hypothetical protein
MKDRLKQLKLKHEKEIKKLEKELEIVNFLYSIGLKLKNDSRLSVFDDFITISGLEHNSEVIDILSKLKPYFEPMYIKESGKLGNGYNIVGNTFCTEEVCGIRVDYNHAEHKDDVKLKVVCKIDNNIYDIWISIPNPKGYTSVDKEYVVNHEYQTLKYSNSRLHTSLTDLDTSIVQRWASHEHGLNSFTVWFEDCPGDIEEFVNLI